MYTVLGVAATELMDPLEEDEEAGTVPAPDMIDTVERSVPTTRMAELES